MKYFLSVVIIVLLFAGCAKNHDNDPLYYNSDFKSHFYYQKGSYWIMYDSVNNHTDSLVVTSVVDYPPFRGVDGRLEVTYIGIDQYDKTLDSAICGWNLVLKAPSSMGYYSNFLTGVFGFDSYPISTSSTIIYYQNYYTFHNVYKLGFQHPFNQDNAVFINDSLGFVAVHMYNTAKIPLASKHLSLIRSHVIR